MQRDPCVEGPRKIEDLKEQSQSTPFVPPKRPIQKTQKPKRKKRGKPRTATPLEQEVLLCKKLHEKHKKRTKINLAKLIKRLHVQPKYKAYRPGPKSGQDISQKGKGKQKGNFRSKQDNRGG